MSISAAGDLKNVSIEGIGFDVITESDMDIKPSKVTEPIVTSGETIHKVKRQNSTAEGIKLAADKEKRLMLDAWLGQKDLQFVVEDAGGNLWYNTGSINITGSSTQENSVSITFNTDGDWA